MQSERLHFSTLVRVGQSILFVAAVLALVLVVVDMYRQRTDDGMPGSGTERTEPSHYYYIDARV